MYNKHYELLNGLNLHNSLTNRCTIYWNINKNLH